jgi:hypothetical protein
VAHALRHAGVAVTSTPSLGTSGGSWAAAAAFAGLAHEQLRAVTGTVSLPDYRRGRLHAAGRELFGDRREPLLSTAAVRLRDGRRTVLSGADHTIADILAASSSVPWMTIPHQVGSYRYVDGGARSWISADLAPSAERLIVIAPGVDPALGRLGVALRAHLGVEIRRWRRRCRGRVYVIRADEDLGRRVTRWRHLFDHALAREAYDRAYASTLDDVRPHGRLHHFLAWPA